MIYLILWISSFQFVSCNHLPVLFCHHINNFLLTFSRFMDSNFEDYMSKRRRSFEVNKRGNYSRGRRSFLSNYDNSLRTCMTAPQLGPSECPPFSWALHCASHKYMALPNANILRIMVSEFSTLRPRQNGCNFPDGILECIFLNENIWISIKISLKFVPKGPILQHWLR